MDPELARKNLALGLALFALVLILFAGSIAIARSTTRSASRTLPRPGSGLAFPT